MNDLYKVSILVPVYNVEKYVSKCLESLFSQTYTNLEYIFIDDCSTDNSMKIIIDFLDLYKQRKESVKIIKHEKNRGLAAARNTAVKAATGEFIVHVDSDDWVETSMIEKLVQMQQNFNADIVNCGHILHTKRNTIMRIEKYNEDVHKLTLNILRGDLFHYIWGRLIRKALYETYNIKNIEGANVSEDLYTSSLLFYNAHKIVYLKEALYHYNCFNDSSYCSYFTEDKNHQDWVNRDYLREYFESKGKEYNEAMDFEHTKFGASSILRASSEPNHREYIKWIRERLDKIDKGYRKYLCREQRIALKIRSYALLRVFTISFNFFKKMRSLIGSRLPGVRDAYWKHKNNENRMISTTILKN